MAEVACSGERVSLVVYRPIHTDGTAGRETYDLWARELALLFPYGVATATGIEFYCAAKEISVSLSEQREAGLLVVPSPGVC
jgi:hypothetical protein